MEYAQRKEFANQIYKNGLKKVSETPAPAEQKFAIGAFVKIAKNLGEHMAHFESDRFARVQYTYAHAYGGNDCKSYSLLVQYENGKWGSVAWYYEDQLEEVTDSKILTELSESVSHYK